MRIEDYDSLTTKFRENGDRQAMQKRIEYTESRGDEDVLANFKATAKTFDVGTLQVLGVFMQKHYSSIVNYIKTGEVHSESIHGRIMDLIQYLELTHACIVEMEQEETPEPVNEINKESMSLLAKKRGVSNE